jgi:glycine cleavage system H protein
MANPTNLKYSKEHEWVLIEGNIATIGITDYAQNELGEIVFVEVETIDETLEQNEVFGSVEAVKTVSELFMPIAGKVIELNAAIEDKPELLNEAPYGEGWIIKVEMTDASQADALMSAEEYEALIGA